MTKLNKSIRSALNFYGPQLRAGHYVNFGWTGSWSGEREPIRFSSAYCDIENGLVSDLRIYGSGDTIIERDAFGSFDPNDPRPERFHTSTNISPAIFDYIKRGCRDWGLLISDIEEIIKENL